MSDRLTPPATSDTLPMKDLILQAVARGWCSPENSSKVMDATLAQAISEEVYRAVEERMACILAGISTASFGYWKEGDDIHPDFDTVALHDVAKLYAKSVRSEDTIIEDRSLASQIRARKSRPPDKNDVNAEAISILTQRAGGELFIPNGPDIKVGTTWARVEENGVRFKFVSGEAQ